MKLERILGGSARLLPLLYLGLFFLFPLVSILVTSLGGRADILFDPVTWSLAGRRLGFTLWQAFLSTLLTLAVGLPAAYVFSHYRFPGKAILEVVTTLPFVLPTVVVGAAFNTLLGPHGWIYQAWMVLHPAAPPSLHLLHTLWAILIAHVFYNTGIFIRLVGGEWSRLDPRYELAARSLGANSREVLWRVTLPLLKPAILAGILLVFLFDFTSFGVILILGGFGFATLEVEIYTQATQMLNLPLAAVLSLIQLVSTLLITSLSSRATRNASVFLPPAAVDRNLREPAGWLDSLGVYALSTGLLIIFALPLLSLVIRSFTLSGGFQPTAMNYLSLLKNPRSSYFYVPPVLALRNSLVFATATAFLSLWMGIPAAYGLSRPGRWSRLGESLYLLPLGTSAVTLGLGFVVAFFQPPFNWQASAWLIPVAHSLVALPFVVRSLLPAIRSLPAELRQSAELLGASPFQRWWRVDLPILSRPVATGAIYAFNISMGEFGATAFLARPEYPTIPVAIYRYLSQPGELNYGQALAMSTLLLLVCASGIVGIEKLRGSFQ